MAFRDSTEDADFLSNIPKHRDNLFFNLDGFVGPKNPRGGIHRGSQNRPDDVMLVQHFLKIIALNPGKFTSPFKPPTPIAAMNVDGKFGPITANWITAFQQHLIRIGKHIFSDSCVDKIFNRVKFSPNGFLWTLFMLNVAMGQVTGDDLWDEWWKDSSVPALLRDRVRDPASFL